MKLTATLTTSCTTALHVFAQHRADSSKDAEEVKNVETMEANMKVLIKASDAFQQFVVSCKAELHPAVAALEATVQVIEKEYQITCVKEVKALYRSPVGEQVYSQVQQVKALQTAFGQLCVAVGLDAQKTFGEISNAEVYFKAEKYVSVFGFAQSATRKLVGEETRAGLIDTLAALCAAKNGHKETHALPESPGSPTADHCMHISTYIYIHTYVHI